ncbi:MAG: hypothetical protein R3E96_13525 [Planctomycetota bacterium]
MHAQVEEGLAQGGRLGGARLAALRRGAHLDAALGHHHQRVDRLADRLHDRALGGDDRVIALLHVDRGDAVTQAVLEVEVDRVERVVDVEEGHDVEGLVGTVGAVDRVGLDKPGMATMSGMSVTSASHGISSSEALPTAMMRVPSIRITPSWIGSPSMVMTVPALIACLAWASAG